MGEEKELPKVFAIDNEPGESFEIGTLAKIELAEDRIMSDDTSFANLGESIEAECVVKIKTIKKKRFIKLLMAKGYQKNEAIIMHEEYRKQGYLRSILGLELFVSMYEFIKKEMEGLSTGKVIGIYGEYK